MAEFENAGGTVATAVHMVAAAGCGDGMSA